MHADYEILTMKRVLLGMLVLTVLMFACKGKQTESAAEDVLEDTVAQQPTD